MTIPISPRLNKRNLMLLGFFVAVFSAGIGIGEGTILVSLLISLFGLDFKKAAGMSLATIIPISCVGAIGHFILLSGVPDVRYYLFFIPSCVAGTILGVGIFKKGQNRWLKSAFSVFLLIVSLRMLHIADSPSLMFKGLHSILVFNEFLIIIGVGICIGMIAVVLGIGCGLLIVPFFVIMIGLSIHQAITLSLVTMFFLSVSGTVLHNRFKNIDFADVKYLLFPALFGAIIGAMISGMLPAATLKTIFGIFLFVIACNYIIRDIMDYKPAKLRNKV